MRKWENLSNKDKPNKLRLASRAISSLKTHLEEAEAFNSQREGQSEHSEQKSIEIMHYQQEIHLVSKEVILITNQQGDSPVTHVTLLFLCASYFTFNQKE